MIVFVRDNIIRAVQQQQQETVFPILYIVTISRG